MTDRYAPYATATDAVLTFELNEGCETEEEYIAYVKAVIDTGLVNATGTHGRLVRDAIETYGIETFQ